MTDSPAKVVLITGSAQRVGAAMARYFHQRGFNVVVHYRRSEVAAVQLVTELCKQRAASAICFQAGLEGVSSVEDLAAEALAAWGRLDVLINNASSFFPTPLGAIDEKQWNELIDSNLKGPFFLSQACLPALRETGGCIINLLDIHAQRPLAQHTVYCAAKAGLAMLTQAMASEAAPEVRVNGIAPGAILWPEGEASLKEGAKQSILSGIPLGTLGTTDDLAATAWFLATTAPYITGQILGVDGGRSLTGD